MRIPASAHFTPISLSDVFSERRADLPVPLATPSFLASSFDHAQFCGIPFQLGPADGANVVHLRDTPVSVDTGDITATFFLFLHVAEDVPTVYLEGLADNQLDGNELGSTVSDYIIEYDDGEKIELPILRRFAIQQSRIQWGASAFAAIPAARPEIILTATEAFELGRISGQQYGRAEMRHSSGRDRMAEKVWLYALPNPKPETPVRRLVLQPREEASAIYAISYTQLEEHPLRPGLRQKLRLTLPEGAHLNALGELEDVAVDLGEVISARAVLAYDADKWTKQNSIAMPVRSEREVVIEYAAHPKATLYVGTDDGQSLAYDLSKIDMDDLPGMVRVGAATRPVRFRIFEHGTGRPAAVRLHVHGEAGEYLPPRGHHRKVNGYWFEDYYAEFVNGHNQYSYVEGECIVDLPLGVVYVEMTNGYEIAPIRTSVEIRPDTDELTFELDRVLHWRDRGWVTADTHVHFLSPQTALLEGRAEGVNVVNLLASQWGEMYSNVGDFDGRTTIGARDFGGDGEFLVRVGTENRMQVLGHISLLGYSGEMIHPLCTGGPSESAVGDPQEVTMAEWAQRCIDQGGLVVMPHAPNPQLERAADIVLGLVNAIEMMTFNPLNPANMQISPYGIADWYRYLNLGYQPPVVGGSDKMAASSLLGGIRTYAHLGDREFTYDNWMRAVRAGNTFVTVGPLVSLAVDGVSPGGQVSLPSSGGTVEVEWTVESAVLPIEQVELVVGAYVAEQTDVGGKLSASGRTRIPVAESTWIAVRVRGSYHGRAEQIAAHSSAVQVLVEGKDLFSDVDAIAVLEQIEGALAYVDTLAPRPDVARFKAMRTTLEAAYNRLHQRMHQQGLFHRHTPVSLHAGGGPHVH